MSRVIAANAAPPPLAKYEGVGKGGRNRQNVVYIFDAHLGRANYIEEVGPDNAWGLEIAIDQYRDAMTKLIERLPEADSFVLIVGGDYFDFENDLFRTRKSGNQLTNDSAFSKVIEEGCKFSLDLISQLLKSHKRGEVYATEGNHDCTTSQIVLFGASHRFASEKSA
jgi:hypothetical protein